MIYLSRPPIFVIAHPHHTPIYAARDPPLLTSQTIQHTKTLRWLEKHQSTFKMTRGQFRVDCAGNTKRANYDAQKTNLQNLFLCTTIKRLETLLSHYQNLKRQKDSDARRHSPYDG